MSWNIEIPIIVRTLINDVSDTPTYSDERLLQVIVVAAKHIKYNINLDTVYTVDIVNPSISPDPSVINDDLFVMLVSLKSACLFDQSSLRTKAATEGIRAALGPATLQVAGSLAGMKMILEQGPCATFAELAFKTDIKQASAIRAILSPFVGNKFDPRAIRNSFNGRRDMLS